MKKLLGKAFLWVMFDLPLPKIIYGMVIMRMGEQWQDDGFDLEDARFIDVAGYYTDRL